MLVIGIILFAAAVAGVALVTAGSVKVDVDVFGRVFATSTGVMFVAGLITALAACLSLLLIADGWRRRARATSHRGVLADGQPSLGG